jgi:hypothetical protein
MANRNFISQIQKTMSEKLKSIPVYLTDEKRAALKTISKSKRIAQTRLIEQEIDKLLKREGFKL